jgi:hypothetical protein
MKRIMISALVASTLGFCGGDIAPVEPVVTMPDETVQGWKYRAEIYLWGASIGGTTGRGVPFTIEFSDIMDNLKMAGMGAFAARYDKWTLLADIIYMDVNKKNLNVSPGPGPITLNSLGMKSWIVQPIASYAVYETDVDRFELLAGARYISLDLPVGFSDPIGKITPSDDAWNGIVGFRGTHDFTDKWMGTYHLDIGTGDSDFTWQGIAGIAYKFDSYALHAGYRYLEWDHGGQAIDDLNLGGVFAGVRFMF